MSYIDGFVLPVPQQNRAAYLELAKKASRIFRKHGAIRVVEAWGDDLQVGKVNDFRTAVIAEQGEQVVFSWIEWPDKATRDAAMKTLTNWMNNPEKAPSIRRNRSC